MPELLLILLTVFVFVAMMTAFTLLRWSWAHRRAAARRMLAHRVGPPAEPPPTLVPDRGEGATRWLRQLIERAGSRASEQDLFLFTGLLSFVGLVGSLALFRGPAALLGLSLGLVPLLGLRREANERAARLADQRPEALDRIARTLRAGHAFSDALRSAGDEMPAPVGEELARVSEMHRLGIDMRDCLGALAERNAGSFDIRLFVGAVLLHRETGGNLIEMLDHIAETVRERQTFQRKVGALTAEVRVSALILGALPFLVCAFLLVFQPGYLAPLLKSELGHQMLAVGGGSLLLGALVMRQLARVEV